MAMIFVFTPQNYYNFGILPSLFGKKLTILGKKCIFFEFFMQNVRLFEKKSVSLQAETCAHVQMRAKNSVFSKEFIN